MVLFASVGFSNWVFSQDVVDPTTLNNKIMAGYQGWFGAPGDGSGYGWIHWGDGGGNINAETVTIDYWPDMREYDADELFETDFVYNDLTNAGLYSAYTKKTVDRHVKWMKEYGIDGVFVQRFISSALSRKKQRDTVLMNVRYGAERYGRVFANMYDMSGGKPETFVQDVITDWKHLVDNLKITESPNYLHHNGLPVLSLWGVNAGGSKDIITAAMWAELLQWFTVDAEAKYKVTLKAGVTNSWKEDNQEWQAVYDKFDFISPWAVGRYNSISGADNYRNQYFEADLNETASRDMEYIPVVFPGFSWSNLYPGKELNQIPRIGGKFYWHQLYNAIDAGCNMVYVAMFDEVDEGTAIYKLAETKDQLPTTGNFVTLDMDGYDLPSDWYLKLTGEATKMLRGEIPVTSTIPIVARPENSGFNSQDVPTIMSPGVTLPVEITMENLGTGIWTKIDNYALFSSVSSTTDTWGVNQIDLNDSDAINPNESKTFSFDITAPAAEGVYEFQWRMKKDGNWFGASSNKRYINVSDSPNFFDPCDALSDWTSAGSLNLNSSDQQQGTACIEFTGGTENAIEFEKVLANPYNSGITAYDAVLQFWYYVSDKSLSSDMIKVGLGSAGKADENEYTWNAIVSKTGWNLITLFVKNATVKGTPDLNALNWFQIQNTKSGTFTSRIDEIQLFDRYSGAAKFNLVVINGSGSGQYVKDALVPIAAIEAPVGQEFAGWTINTGNVLFENEKAMNTRIRILGGDVEIAAVYKVLGSYLDDCDDLDGWGSSAVLALNTTDQQEGAACIEFTGDATDEYKKAFAAAYNSGATVESGRLEFWYYTSDASLMGANNQVELGSGGRPDQSEYSWNLSGLTTGWNFISLAFSNAGIVDVAPDLSKINWFRLYNFKSGTVTTRIDAIEIVDPNGGQRHTLSVKSGTGDGNYFSGTVVNIKADAAPGDQIFDQWVVETGNPQIDNVNSYITNLTMPDEDVVISATYKEVKKYNLIVNNGTGDGSYVPGFTVVISADKAPEGKEFDKWEVNTGTISISNINSTLTYFSMPEEDVEITATYKYPNAIENKTAYGLSVYPNPVDDELTVAFKIEKPADIRVSITDLSGRMVRLYNDGYEKIAGNYYIKIPVSSLSNGIYLLNLTIDDKVLNELIRIK